MKWTTSAPEMNGDIPGRGMPLQFVSLFRCECSNINPFKPPVVYRTVQDIVYTIHEAIPAFLTRKK